MKVSNVKSEMDLNVSQIRLVVVDPSCRMLYASFYLYGIAELIGKGRMKFQSQPFRKLQLNSRSDKYERFLAIVVVYKNGGNIKLIIDYHDDNVIDEEALAWCDIYGKTNFPVEIDSLYPNNKVVPVAPGFGIRYFTNYYELITIGIRNYLKSRKISGASASNFFAGYFSRKRVGMEFYKPSYITEENYVFYVSSLWSHRFCVENTNPWRYEFMTMCKNEIEGLTFEGGFLVGKNTKINDSEIIKYRELVIKNPILNEDYIAKVSKSMVVFNTPAVHGCHGWKLGEYLALGKAVISTPLRNRLPEPLVHGENVHFVQQYGDLRDAILKIKGDINYRRKLERGAYEYFVRNIKPTQVFNLLLTAKA